MKAEPDDFPPPPLIARAVSRSAEIVDAAIAAGVRLSVRDGKLAAGPPVALNPDLLRLLAANEAAIVVELRNRPEPEVGGLECSGCSNLKMRVEAAPGSRRVFWWRCAKGHALAEARAFGERVMIAPTECDDFEQWRPGER